MNLSIIIPTLNSASVICKCLEAIKKSTYDDYEVIVVDGGSIDGTISIAKNHTENVIILDRDNGRGHARNIGIIKSKGQILVFTDSDNIIKKDSLKIIAEYFLKHSDVAAVTGSVSKEHPNQDFFSQYKNLYMCYKFEMLPEAVYFLQGDIYAVRRKDIEISDLDVTTDDTERGQILNAKSKKIIFLKDLCVIHLKKYNFIKLLKNDFKIPYDWVKIFIKYRGLAQMIKNKGNYAHAPKGQLISIILSLLIMVFVFLNLLVTINSYLLLILFLIWFLLNFKFFLFLKKEKGFMFGFMKALPITFLDNIVMITGILFGFLNVIFYKGCKTNKTEQNTNIRFGP
ncbi:MAG: glycosyltransferase family 2 protein [Candidatus Aminicenantes bacterium]|nr:MAG: glycosyltransferase family 2 protein [Candidatus Aminicenantes bacterium]